MQILDIGFLWLAFVSLFAILNPFSTVFVFLAISSGDSQKRRNETAKKACIMASFILIFFIISGSLILNIFNITIEAFQIAGGILISILGFYMIYPKPRLDEEEHKESKKKEDISIVPLAIPMLSGPGAITTALVLTSQADSYMDKIGLSLVVILILLISFFVLSKARYLKKAIGQTGTGVIERLMGLIVIVIGVQFVINALKVIIPSII